MIRLFCIQTYHGHWAGHSGYHRYLSHLGSGFQLDHRRIRRGRVDRTELHGVERILFPIFSRYAAKRANPWTTESDLLQEFRLLGQVRRALGNGEKVVVHFMDGEIGFNFFATYRKFLGKDGERLRLMATYHQPPFYLEKVFPKRARAAGLDLVLTVGTSQFPFFDFLPESKLRFIPHGADTDYFHPAGVPQTADKLYCITVGQWLRDFDALEKIIGLAPPEMVFRIVAVKESLERFRGLANVELYSGIADAELRRLYHQSHIGLMPLQDSTANNGLLEMMASGLPVIVTRVGSVEDYVKKDCCLMIDGNEPEEILQHLRALWQNVEARKRLGNAARQNALEFSWPRIAEQMAVVYGKVFDKTM